jgi:hypothetical protein
MEACSLVNRIHRDLVDPFLFHDLHITDLPSFSTYMQQHSGSRRSFDQWARRVCIEGHYIVSEIDSILVLLPRICDLELDGVHLAAGGLSRPPNITTLTIRDVCDYACTDNEIWTERSIIEFMTSIPTLTEVAFGYLGFNDNDSLSTTSTAEIFSPLRSINIVHLYEDGTAMRRWLTTPTTCPPLVEFSVVMFNIDSFQFAGSVIALCASTLRIVGLEFAPDRLISSAIVYPLSWNYCMSVSFEDPVVRSHSVNYNSSCPKRNNLQRLLATS